MSNLKTNSNEVFCIPHQDQYLIYLPLKGLLFLGNQQFVNDLVRSQAGDLSAQTRIGLTEESISQIFDSSKALNLLSTPGLPPGFKPTAASLFLTNDCTMKCQYCYAEGGSRTDQMPWQMVTGIIDTLAQNVLDLGAKNIRISYHGGGDVSAAWQLLIRTHKYLVQKAYALGVGVRTSVGLNGVLNAKQRVWVIDNINDATVSLDGSPEIQDFLRPLKGEGRSSKIVVETIKAFDQANYPYSIRSTITDFSVQRLAEIVRYFCDEFKVKRIQLEPMYPRGRATNSALKPPSSEVFVEQFREARKIANRAGRQLIYSGARHNVVTTVFCKAAGESCAITPAGDVTSCYEVLDPADPLSDVFFYGRFDPDRKQFVIDDQRRERLFNLNVLEKEFCEKCFCKYHCAGDCPVKSLASSHLSGPDFPDRCYLNRELTKDQLLAALGIED